MREVIKTADWVLDLGPEGGDKGGEVVAEGTPEQVAAEPRSYTSGYLKQLLNGPRAEPPPPRKKKARQSATIREREAAE
jgi:excinuclease ABC subunit A